MEWKIHKFTDYPLNRNTTVTSVEAIAAGLGKMVIPGPGELLQNSDTKLRYILIEIYWNFLVFYETPKCYAVDLLVEKAPAQLSSF